MKCIFLVEDHVAFRQALAHIFKPETSLEQDAQAGTLAEGRRRMRSLDGDIESPLWSPVCPTATG